MVLTNCINEIDFYQLILLTELDRLCTGIMIDIIHNFIKIIKDIKGEIQTNIIIIFVKREKKNSYKMVQKS